MEFVIRQSKGRGGEQDKLRDVVEEKVNLKYLSDMRVKDGKGCKFQVQQDGSKEFDLQVKVFIQVLWLEER